MHKTLMKLPDEQFVDEINKAFVRKEKKEIKNILYLISFRHLMLINKVELFQ
jgi:hypothetical protein